MYFKGCTLRVNNAEEENAYVKMRHGQRYDITIASGFNVKSDAVVYIDGKEVGIYRLEAYGSIRLERPLNDNGRFTFYRKNSNEFKKSRLNEVPSNDLGLISVHIYPEILKIPSPWHWPVLGSYLPDNWVSGQPFNFTTSDADGPIASNSTEREVKTSGFLMAAGGTGLSGHSNQGFIDVHTIERDYNNSVSLNLRLVEDIRPDEHIRPLTSYSTKVPEPV